MRNEDDKNEGKWLSVETFKISMEWDFKEKLSDKTIRKNKKELRKI